MNPLILSVLYRPFVNRAARSALIGRCRDRYSPEKGRFTHADADRIIIQVWKEYHRIAPSVPREPKIGNQLVMLLACITLSCFRTFMSAGIQREYAIELIGDAAWSVYASWGRLLKVTTRLLTRDYRERIRLPVNMFLRFPFTPPGYLFNRLPSTKGISLDMLRCPVAEYMRAQEAPDLCEGAWCNLDFPLAEMWGGWLERTQTLAAGSAICNFRFKARAERMP